MNLEWAQQQNKVMKIDGVASVSPFGFGPVGVLHWNPTLVVVQAWMNFVGYVLNQLRTAMLGVMC